MKLSELGLDKLIQKHGMNTLPLVHTTLGILCIHSSCLPVSANITAHLAGNKKKQKKEVKQQGTGSGMFCILSRAASALLT